MKTNLLRFYQFLLVLCLFESSTISKPSNAFFPKVNEPNEQELKSKKNKTCGSIEVPIRFFFQ